MQQPHTRLAVIYIYMYLGVYQPPINTTLRTPGAIFLYLPSWYSLATTIKLSSVTCPGVVYIAVTKTATSYRTQFGDGGEYQPPVDTTSPGLVQRLY